MPPDEPELTEVERRLIDKHLEFYRSLALGHRTPTTQAQVDFVAVCEGRATARTSHELAYIRYRRLELSELPPPKSDPREPPEWCSDSGWKSMRSGNYADMKKRQREG